LASLMGLLLFLGFDYFAFFGIILIAITLITDYIALGTITVASLLPVYILIFGKDVKSMILIFIALAAIIVYKHKDNILRLKNGTEIGFLHKNKYKK
ncbi:MAG: glycerol-3-phosphate acyltransferase, partial [Oscillospiraceae bacterium]|nr:glycerol-3-phosphate acyltransferase [Oscillospiraceae bacterium]